MKLHLKISISKPGTALLLTLLMLTAVSTVLLVSSHSYLSGIRYSTDSDNLIMAENMAKAGLREGLIRFKNGYGLDNGEYGSKSNTPYSLYAWQRPFFGSDCGSLNSDQSIDQTLSYSSECPFYELAIRKKAAVGLIGSPPSGEGKKKLLSQIDFYNGTASFTVESGPLGMFSLYAFFEDPIAGRITCTSGCTLLNNPVGHDQPIVINGSPVTLVLSNGTKVAGEGVKVMGMFGTELIISKDYTSIVSTGYAGGVKKTMIGYKRPDSNLQIFDFAATISEKGIQQP